MFLKTLHLEGFKSFVDRTHLHFNNGFTAIVGPNGCGKSNVSDAIRWVIGEQSSKSLRGNRSIDLIFNGTRSRKPVNRAEISLTLSNVPAGIRIAEVPNLTDEVKITRCYHRSGESEFYINDVPCRLKDITDFLLDVGISPKVLTVIEQGHIQDIITAKPEDRRILIEEAAGILKFKHRRNEALRKLETSRQNLERVSDLVQELGRQAESLKRQAAKAERYKRYQAEIKDRSLKLFARKIRTYQAEGHALQDQLTALQERKAERSARASLLDNQITQIHLEIDEGAARLNEKKEKVHALNHHIDKNEHSIALKKSQIEQAETDIQSAADEIDRMNREIEAIGSETEKERENLAAISAQINEQEDILKNRTEALEEDREALRRTEAEVLAGEEKAFSLYQRISQKKNELTALATREQGLKTRDEKLELEQTETLAQMKQTLEARLEAETVHAENERQLEALKTEQASLRDQSTEARTRLENLSAQASEVKEEYLQQASRLASLKELRNQFEGFQQGIKTLMTANGERLAGLREVLVDVLKAPAEYEAAVEAVLGEKLQSIIVNSYHDTLEAIDYLKTHHSGKGSFIPLDPKGPPHPPISLNGNPAVLGRVLDFIECKEEYQTILERLLGNVVLVQDLATALQLRENPQFQGTIVTRQGEMIDAQGLVTGGSDEDGSSGLLARNREMESLAGRAHGLQQQLEAIETDREEQKQTATRLDDRLRQMEQTVHEREIANSSSRKDLELQLKEIERLEQKRETLDYERSAGRHELEELNAHRDRLEHELGTDEEEKNLQEEQLDRLRGERETRREDLEGNASEISSIKVLIASLIGRRENTLTEIKRLDLQRENLVQRIGNREEDRQTNRRRIDELRETIETLEKQIVETAREKDRVSAEAVHDEETLRDQDAALKKMEQETKDLARQIQQLTETLAQVELKKSEVKIQMAHIEERAYDDFNVTLAEVLRAYDETMDEKEFESRVRELKGKIGKMGEVNLAALSDFQEVNERYQFLKRQQDDLTESIELLLETIDRINKNTRQRFVETFDQVNENFKTIFARLFQGGKAELKLSDPGNPLESGVEVSANPLGKIMQNLSLLSGGEKSLTAIALLFAVFKVRPSPFCLLDEVDAPLDEANVIRFQEMLKEIAVNTQFILITHNQKTMSFADVLYGITMEEQGVSKIVSVHLN